MIEMTEVYLKKNVDGRFDCFNALTDEYIQTLTCGNPFMLIAEDEDLEVPGRIDARRGAAVCFQHQRGMAPVGHPVVLAQGHSHIERGRGHPAPGPLAVDRPHHLGIEAQAGVEGEIPVPGQAQADALGPHVSNLKMA